MKEQERLLMVELPINQEILINSIEQIKKITNAECKSALSYLNN